MLIEDHLILQIEIQEMRIQLEETLTQFVIQILQQEEVLHLLEILETLELLEEEILHQEVAEGILA